MLWASPVAVLEQLSPPIYIISLLATHSPKPGLPYQSTVR
jgi:hypothetical protein